MNILVTGAHGFIGSHVVHTLIKQGHNVTALDKAPRTRHFSPYHAKTEIVDIEDYLALKKVFKAGNFQTVIHLAARAGVAGSLDEPEAYWVTNVEGFYNVAKLCQGYNIKKLIYASSSSVYGDGNDMYCKSVYAKTKASNEETGRLFSKHMRVIGLRFFTVYGEHGRPEMSIYKWTRNALNSWNIEVFDPKNIIHRYYTYIDDITEGISKLVVDPVEIGNTIHDIAGLSSVPILQAATLIKVLTKSPSLVITKESLDYDVVSCEPTYRIPGLQPTPFVEGITKFIKWAQNGGIPHDS